MKIPYPRRLKLAITPTPIEPMPRLSAHFGGPAIFFKRDDLTGATLSGNKIRKLEFSIAEAQREKAAVIITAGGVQSNHCRATALVCARLGLECHLILRGALEGPPDGNLLLDHLAGARISYYPREVYSTKRMEIVGQLTEDYARDGKKAYYIPVGASNAIGSWGYVRAYEEILAQSQRAGEEFDYVVVALGSGGTAAGLIVGKALSGSKRPQVLGINICDDAESFRNDITTILDEMNAKFSLKLKPAQTPIHIADGYVGEGYGIPYADAMSLIATVGRLEGQILDPVYTGKALFGLGEEIRKGRFRKKDRILFIHTGGVFGLFPQKEVFRFS